LTAFVLDASVALAWCFRDQANDATHDLFEQAITDGAIVPSHWALEIASAVRIALRAERTNEANRREFLGLLDAAQIEVDVLTHARAGHETLDLAIAHDLTPYDAAYLELARRRDLPLATRDRRLAQAARTMGLKTIEP
jgi:predicted nucleic acid-binding protein